MLPYSKDINRTVRVLAEADAVLIGAGAGLSAAAGLNYQDPALFKAWYPQFTHLGFDTIWGGVTAHWAPNDSNRRRFWAFWANHIQKIRYDAPPGPVYQALCRMVYGKKHFVITTNVDGQFVKAGFDPANLYTPQGDYGMFQCAVPCSPTLYDNREWVRTMLANLDTDQLLIREDDIPRCPRCGGYLERNLRVDDTFVETPYLNKRRDFTDFVQNSVKVQLVLLEMGLGYNTPGIIRFPFEQIAHRHPNAVLIRVNLDDARVPAEIEDNSICFQRDVSVVIQDLLDAAGTL